jgi:hypothetical protein
MPSVPHLWICQESCSLLVVFAGVAAALPCVAIRRGYPRDYGSSACLSMLVIDWLKCSSIAMCWGGLSLAGSTSTLQLSRLQFVVLSKGFFYRHRCVPDRSADALRLCLIGLNAWLPCWEERRPME